MILTLPSMHRGKLVDSLAAIPNQAAIVPKKKWYRLLRILRRAVPEISWVEGISNRLQHSHKTIYYRRIKLILNVHNELRLWRNFVDSLRDRQTQIREIKLIPPKRTGVTDTYLTGM